MEEKRLLQLSTKLYSRLKIVMLEDTNQIEEQTKECDSPKFVSYRSLSPLNIMFSSTQTLQNAKLCRSQLNAPMIYLIRVDINVHAKVTIPA